MTFMHENSRKIPGEAFAEPGKSPSARRSVRRLREEGVAGNLRRPAGLSEDLAGYFRRSAGAGATSTAHISWTVVHIRHLADNFAKSAGLFRVFAGVPAFEGGGSMKLQGRVFGAIRNLARKREV